MKAVEFEEFSIGGWRGPYRCADDFDHDLRLVLTGWRVRNIPRFRVRYDNGQMCTFRRRTIQNATTASAGRDEGSQSRSAPQNPTKEGSES